MRGAMRKKEKKFQNKNKNYKQSAVQLIMTSRAPQSNSCGQLNI